MASPRSRSAFRRWYAAPRRGKFSPPQRPRQRDGAALGARRAAPGLLAPRKDARQGCELARRLPRMRGATGSVTNCFCFVGLLPAGNVQVRGELQAPPRLPTRRAGLDDARRETTAADEYSRDVPQLMRRRSRDLCTFADRDPHQTRREVFSRRRVASPERGPGTAGPGLGRAPSQALAPPTCPLLPLP